MAREKTSVQIFFEEQLKDQEFAESFYQGLDELRIRAKNLLDRGSKSCRDDDMAVKEAIFTVAD